MQTAVTQRDRAIQLMKMRGMVRLREFLDAGVSATTIHRMVENEEVFQLDRGLYQLMYAPQHAMLSLAVTAKRAPNSVVCLLSALSYHELTEILPHDVWLAVGPKDPAPKFDHLQIEYSRFSEPYLSDGVITRKFCGVQVRIYSVAKTIADCFRHRHSVSTFAAIEGLQKAIRHRKATPANIVRHAKRRGVYKLMEPYLYALLQEERVKNA